MAVSGVSKQMKARFGAPLVAAVAQADAHVARVLAGQAEVDDFKLDTAQLFPRQQVQGGGSGGGSGGNAAARGSLPAPAALAREVQEVLDDVDWEDDSDDGWDCE